MDRPAATGGYAVAGAGVRIRLRHVDRDDGRYDDAIGGPDVSYVCPRGPADRAARQVAQGDRLVRGWLFPGLSRLRALRHIGAMGVRAQCFARFHHGKHGQRPRRARFRCGRPVPMDPAE